MLQIFQPGNRNADAGPDFSDARIKIENIEWRGSVEIHINASGWMDHHHGEDSAYEKVILHVVWENDKPIERTDGTLMPTLELKNRVDLELWNRYKKLYTSAEEIPCGASWPSVQEITKVSMLDKTVMQRLESKAKLVVAALNKNGNDWEETSYQLLLKNFGFKVNVEAMERLGQVLSYKVLLKHLDKPYQIEALLFGQAGLLEDVNEDDYTSLLKREFKVLQKKYTLEGKQMNAVQWRFLRLRPANFPTMRLAQAAALLVQNQNLFSKILERENPNHLMKLFAVDQSDYWKSHYQFGKQTKGQTPSLGKSSIQNIVMNTVVPMLVAYGKLHDEQLYVERAVDLLQLLPAETNKITKQWAAVGFKPRTAFDSQGLIELYNNFCMKRRCLDCNVGAYLVNKSLS
jgi:hypothetical protein